MRLPEVDSTNTWSLGHLAELGHGSVVVAERQTGGRGQHGRSWVSPPGCLTASFIIRSASATRMRHLGLVAGLAVIEAASDLLPASAPHLSLKWPNDVWLHGRKVAGILCESRLLDAAACAVVVGIGLNLRVEWGAPPLSSLSWPDLHAPPTSLHVCGEPPADDAWLASLRKYLIEGAGLLEAGRWSVLATAIRRHDGLLGTSVRVTRPGSPPRVGIVRGIDDDGHLQLDLGDGALIALDAGHVTPLSAPTPLPEGPAL